MKILFQSYLEGCRFDCKHAQVIPKDEELEMAEGNADQSCKKLSTSFRIVSPFLLLLLFEL